MWKTALTSFVSAILGGLLVFSAMSGVVPRDYQKDDIKAIVKEARESNSSQELSAGEIYERFGAGVVHIRSVFTGTRTDFFGFIIPEKQVADGSGFIIDKSGLIVTNAHVVQDSRTRANRITVVLDDKTELEAKLLGTDVNTDLALLKIDPGNKKLSALELGDSSKLRVGDIVYAIGSPFGLEGTMTQGIVSALNRTIDSPNRQFRIRNVIQTDAAVNPGNSGGPLISSDGKVVGVNSQIAARSGDFAGIAFAVPSNTVKEVTSQIQKQGRASHPWVGISGEEINKELAEFLKLPVSKGIMIARVFPGSPAEKAGLKGGNQSLVNNETGERFIVGGDIITKINKEKITSMDELLSAIRKHKVGDQIELEIHRDNEKKVIKLKLGELPQSAVE